MSTVNWPEFVAFIQQHQRFVLTSHLRPDCDALGSELGMAGVLEALGKEARIVNPQATPPNLAFIDPHNKIETINETVPTADLLAAPLDALLILDTSAWQQLGPMREFIQKFRGAKAVLDHHVSEDDLGATSFKNTTAEATGRLVVDAAEQLGVPLTPAMAMPLFAALATDTGWFRFNSTTEYTYQVAAKLTAAGAQPASIYRDLYEQDTLGRVRLRGLILARFELEMDGRLAHTYVRASDFAQTGALPSDTEDVINAGLGVAGAEAAVILVEQ
ncbi:MAG: bifunctional oligoribonuclease/PAP phosphatase NrnA, partial [Planctomycetales bacterium]|nr:bifunctional oligoribonuclease/PAP phosphatase NrnA [Planctomycetales bacterium]